MNLYLIILIVIDVLLVLPFLYYFGKLKLFEHYKRVSMFIVKSFGFLITLFGDIGSGKSSSLSALSHAYQLDFQSKAMNQMLEVKKIFKHLDFNVVDQYIISKFQELEIYDIRDIAIQLLTDFSLNNTIVFDYLQHKTVLEYFEDYIYAFYVLYIRNNYVYSVTSIYSRVTGNYNMKFDLKWHNIKQAYLNKKYYIENYAVELLDESSDELSAGNWREFDKDETGAKEYRRKYRHLHKENNRMIDTRQDSSDMVKRFRTLTQTHLETVSTNFINVFKELEIIYQFIINSKIKIYKLFKLYIPYFFYRIKRLRSGMSYFQYYDIKYARVNYLRSKDNLSLYFSWFLKSLGYVKIDLKKYHKYDDVGKSDPSFYDPIKLYFPVSWTFGTYEQFAFSEMQRQLNKTVHNNYAEVNVFFKPDFFEKAEKEENEMKVGDYSVKF